MAGRTFAPPTPYKYGFNGKENDNEVVGTGQGTQDYGLRIYNPSLGKFLSVDPLFKEYAYKSTYDFSENSPILGKDLDGGELQIDIEGNKHEGPIDIALINNEILKRQAASAQSKGMNNPSLPNNENKSGDAFKKILDNSGTAVTVTEMATKTFVKKYQMTKAGNFRPRTSAAKEASDVASATKGVKGVGAKLEIATMVYDSYKILTADDEKEKTEAKKDMKKDVFLIGISRINPATGIIIGLYDSYKDDPEFIMNQYNHFKKQAESGKAEDISTLSKYTEQHKDVIYGGKEAPKETTVGPLQKH